MLTLRPVPLWSNTCTLPGVDGETDAVAGIHARAAVRDEDELRLARLDQQLRLRAGRLDDHDLADDRAGRRRRW